MTPEKYNILTSAMETRTRNDGQEFYCLKDNTLEDIKEIIHNILFECDEPLDQAYNLMNDALNCLSGLTLETLADFDPYTTDEEFASVYTATRLSYLNNGNQADISDITKEYDCDIQTACAIWWDNQVKNMVEQLKAKILDDNV